MSILRRQGSALVILLVAAAPVTAGAATLRVCASGCAYTGLQQALNAAQPGDTILLKAGQTFVGNVWLPKKATPASGPAFILIRSDASDALLPPAGTRLVPSGRTGANTSTANLARLIGYGATYKNTAVIRTAAGAHHYRFQFVEIDGSANIGYAPLVKLGDIEDQTSLSAAPYEIVFDRVYLHGHKYKGQKRGFELNSKSTQILNSYVADIKAYGFDSQAILGVNGPGPYKIVNNHLEGAAENIMFGGATPAIANLVPSNIEIRGNLLTKPLAWRKPILASPGSPKVVSSTSSGVLKAAKHYFKVVAVMSTNGSTVRSLPSSEIALTLASGTTSVTLTWSGVSGADRYRVYRGTSAGTENVYLETSTPATSFTYTGRSEIAGTPPGKAPFWSVKNLIELKCAQDVIIDRNIIEYNWTGAGDQAGYALLLRSDDQGKAPWTVVQRVTISRNLIRHVPGGVNLLGVDGGTVIRANHITIRNNVWHDLNPTTWGGVARFAVINGVNDVTIDHNTIVSSATAAVWATGSTVSKNFVYRNNMSLHNTYGFKGDGTPVGTATLTKFFPGASFAKNVLAGGPSASYPSGNFFPGTTDWKVGFVNYAGGDYRLASTSPYNNAGTDGLDLGADIGVIPVLEGATAATASNLPTSTTTNATSGQTSSTLTTTASRELVLQDGPSEVVGAMSAPDDAATETGTPVSVNRPPTADAGGPYTGSRGQPIVFDGSGSQDPEGTVASYTWQFGDEVVIHASDVAPTGVHGGWATSAVTGAAEGVALVRHEAESGEGSPESRPGYVDATFQAAQGVPYRVWVRVRALDGSAARRAVRLTFSGSTDRHGAPVFRIGSPEALSLDSPDAATDGWAWRTAVGGSPGTPIYFASAGTHRVRLEATDGGIAIDQVVLSAGTYAHRAPGRRAGDRTIVPQVLVSSDVATASHAYPVDGIYPVMLTVRDAEGAESQRQTVVTVGRPPRHPVSEIVLHASDIAMGDVAGAWERTADASAADGTAFSIPDAGASMLTRALATPADFIDVPFEAQAGVAYHLWVRMRAAGDASGNDSIYVQFSGSTTEGGSAYRIGSSDAAVIELGRRRAAVRGWGWRDGGAIFFDTTGTQRLRIQVREDGAVVDQIVLSPSGYRGEAPGSATEDATLRPSTASVP